MLLDSMDDVSQWRTKKDDERIVLSAEPSAHEGEAGIRIAITEGIFVLALKTFAPDPVWNDFDGLSFWLKGDGSENWGCVRLQAGSYEKGYVGTFPLRDTDWHQVTLAWQDLVPGHHGVPELGTRDGFRPGDVNLIGWGNSWNFNTSHQVPGVTFKLRLSRLYALPARAELLHGRPEGQAESGGATLVDELMLVNGVRASRPRLPLDRLPPLSAVVAKLEGGKPVTVLALGDSLTWGTNAGGNTGAYPARLGRMLSEHYGNDQVTVLNRAIGGSTTAKGRQWLKRDVTGLEADLVTVMFGFNEMPSQEDPRASARSYTANLIRYVEEVAGQMKTPPACIFIATVPGREKAWERLDVYAQAVREVADQHPNVTVADANGHFKEMGKEAYAPLMTDEAHPNGNGQEEIAKVLFHTLLGQRSP